MSGKWQKAGGLDVAVPVLLAGLFALVVGITLVLALGLPGCGYDGCTRNSDCPPSATCNLGGHCVRPGDLDDLDAGTDATSDAGSGDGGPASDADAGAGDGGAEGDAGAAADAAVRPDAGPVMDAAPPADGASLDAALPVDADLADAFVAWPTPRELLLRRHTLLTPELIQLILATSWSPDAGP